MINFDDWKLLFPLGIIGLIRWTCWLLRRIPAAMYKPYVSNYRSQIAVVTPVYQEDPIIFETALRSWLASPLVAEVWCVCDITEETCAAIARNCGDARVNVLMISEPGKRPALRLGWEHATAPLVALVDSDTIWAGDVADRVCEPFEDERIWGVGTRQNVWEPQSLLERFTDVFLDLRYFDENASQTALGRAVSCLSGRTAVYRLKFLRANGEEFLAETFAGVPCNSGDDKRLTSLLLEQGGLTYMQRSARVWSTFPPDFPTFFKQRVRWARNTWRSDFRAFYRRWVFRKPFLAYTMADKMVSGFTLLLSPIFMVLLVTRRHWMTAALLFLWWMVSRTAKNLPHILRNPQDLMIMPFYVAMSFVMAMIKIWALLSIRTQKWLTRKVAVVDGRVTRTAGPT
jgi:cellulose synthase/poly-beta-1,6-N-acetylglucosamine synthase-like glycosyltransferase